MNMTYANSLFEIEVKIIPNIDKIITGNPNMKPTGIPTLIMIAETRTRHIPMIAKGKTFLFNVSIPPVNPNANPKTPKIPISKSAAAL